MGRSASTHRCVWAALALAAFGVARSAAAVELLHDDFDGPGLDAALWFQPSGDGTFLGRTQLRPPEYPVEVSGGILRMALDTWNPSANTPGDSFFGSEIVSHLAFSPADGAGGIAIEARVRLVPPLAPGLVAACFVYDLVGEQIRDEIDVEILTNFAGAELEQILTNAFDDADFSQPGDVAAAAVFGFDPIAWNDYAIWWRPDRIQWFVNGSLVRQEFATVPLTPLRLRLDFWAPDASFAVAWSPELQPAASASANASFVCEVDSVSVRTLPEPDARTALAAALLALVLLGERRTRRAGAR